MIRRTGAQPVLTDFAPRLDNFRAEVLYGLSRARKELYSKYMYDERGSQLFEQICELDEYYPTRTELHILRTYVQDMAALLGKHCQIIEYGSGSSKKTRVLLGALQEPVAYVPIDISKGYLLNAAIDLARAYPHLEVLPVCADYTSDFAIPVSRKPVSRRVAYFPGSTIGNFDPKPALRFLQQIARTCQALLIGVDLKKSYDVLHRAYNDRQGVTAAFNLNLLVRINRELGADFQLDQFGHYAFYNPDKNRIEMHLVSLKDQEVRIDSTMGNTTIPFRLGESIWTESSYKYTIDEFAALAALAGFTVEHVWIDEQQWFSVQYLTVRGH